MPTVYRLDWQLENARSIGAPAERLEALQTGRAATHANLRRAIALGVPIVFGTDATVFPHGLNAREFGVLVELGLSPAQAIRAAIKNPARTAVHGACRSAEPGLAHGQHGLQPMLATPTQRPTGIQPGEPRPRPRLRT